MEPKKLKKLTLKKEDISYLNEPAQNRLRGGYGETDIEGALCGFLSILGDTCNNNNTCKAHTCAKTCPATCNDDTCACRTQEGQFTCDYSCCGVQNGCPSPGGSPSPGCP